MIKKSSQGEGRSPRRKNSLWFAQTSIQRKRVNGYFKPPRDGLDWFDQMRNQI